MIIKMETTSAQTFVSVSWHLIEASLGSSSSMYADFKMNNVKQVFNIAAST